MMKQSKIMCVKWALLPPVEGEALVRSEMEGGRLYRNSLVAVERERRAAVRAAVGEHEDLVAALATADATVAAAARAVNAYRSAERARQATPELLAALRAAKETRRVARDALRAMRKAALSSPSVKLTLDMANEQRTERTREERAKRPCYWGTGGGIEVAMQQSAKQPLWDSWDEAPLEPRFVRRTGEGFVRVQLQGGLTVAEAYSGEDTCLRVVRTPDAPSGSAAYPSHPRPLTPVRLRQRCHVLHPRGSISFRVGSDGRAPVWATWPVYRRQRELPAGAVIKEAAVHLRRIGPHEEWYAVLSLEVSACEQERGGDGAVAMDLGWRRMRDGSCRIAVASDEQGHRDELTLPAAHLRQVDHVDSLRSLRDEKYVLAVAWARAIVGDLGSAAPEWLLEAFAHAHAWRSQARLAGVCGRWRRERFAGDDAAFAAVEAWRRWDMHLWTWESAERQKVLARRKDLYRCWTAKLAARYKTLVLEEFDLRSFAVSPEEGEAETQCDERARAQRHRGAPGELRLCLTNAFRCRGGEVVEVDARMTTRKCATCGVVETWDAATELRHTCVNGHEWDQDENAGDNMLARWRERLRDAQAPGPARKRKKSTNRLEGEGKWTAAQRTASERRARIEAARGPSDKTADSVEI